MTGGQEVLTGQPITEAYPVGDYENPAKALAAVRTDAHWATGLAATADLLADETDAYVYELAVDDAPWFAEFERPQWSLGAYHMVDVAFLFDTDIFEERTAEHDRLAEAMVEHWTAFARNGNPGEAWEQGTVRQLTPDGGADIDFAADHRLEFWESLDA